MCGIFLAPLGWSQSLSKDTGLGSTSEQNDTPMSGLDLMNAPTVQQRYGNIVILGLFTGNVLNKQCF